MIRFMGLSCPLLNQGVAGYMIHASSSMGESVEQVEAQETNTAASPTHMIIIREMR